MSFTHTHLKDVATKIVMTATAHMLEFPETSRVYDLLSRLVDKSFDYAHNPTPSNLQTYFYLMDAVNLMSAVYDEGVVVLCEFQRELTEMKTKRMRWE